MIQESLIKTLENLIKESYKSKETPIMDENLKFSALTQKYSQKKNFIKNNV